MYPAQTSLIPATVAIARFFETHGFSSFSKIYPYWYLGSTPFRYLTGPIVPLLLAGLHELLPSVSLFSISIYLILFSFLLAAVGWGTLISKIRNTKIKVQNLLIIFLLLVLPWRYLSSLALDEGSAVIAKNLLPYALIAVWQFLQRKNQKTFFLATLSISFILLINTSILSVLVVAISALILTRAFRKGKVRNISKHIRQSLLLIACCLLLVTLYYAPSYWLTILANPSIGGASGFKVIFRVLGLLRASAPLFLAVFVVYFSSKIKSRFTVFSLTWILTFMFLTLFRFIGDPDFWQDWTAWLYELEIGIALLVSILLTRKRYFVSLILGLLPFLLSFYIYDLLGKPVLLSQDLPQVSSLEKLTEIAETDNVFLSGSTVFWANAFYDLRQVRGGRDQVAIHPSWDKAAWEWREGDSPELAKEWLEELDVSFVLVHGPDSIEHYHDFKNIEKWDKIGKKIWQEQGDMIFEIK